MPTYEYQCADCGHSFEEHQSIMAEPLTTCPKCGKSTVKRFPGGGGGMIFKGSGFHLTDYRKKGESSKRAEQKKTETPTTSETGTNTPTKPATETKSRVSGKGDSEGT